MVKTIHGKYYVYGYFHVKENDKWKTKIGKLIGSIDPVLGYMPNDSIGKDEITTVDFGEYFLSYSLSKNVLDDLMQRLQWRSEQVYQQICSSIYTGKRVYRL